MHAVVTPISLPRSQPCTHARLDTAPWHRMLRPACACGRPHPRLHIPCARFPTAGEMKKNGISKWCSLAINAQQCTIKSLSRRNRKEHSKKRRLSTFSRCAASLGHSVPAASNCSARCISITWLSVSTRSLCTSVGTLCCGFSWSQGEKGRRLVESVLHTICISYRHKLFLKLRPFE